MPARPTADSSKADFERLRAPREEVDPDEVEVLLAIAMLDSEAAQACAIAAGAVTSDELRQMLRAFEGDHRRHIEDLERFMCGRGVKAEPPADASSIVAIADAMGAIDAQAALEAILANELLTNSVYETAVWVVSDADALAIVRRNRADEAQHLEALQTWAAQHMDDEDGI